MEKSLMFKLAAIVVVAVVIAAGAAVVLTSDSDKEKDGDKEKDLSTLYIRGNVDGNYVIDQEDMKLLREVKEDNTLLDKYPYADINKDGSVDDKDISILQDMLDHKEGITVYVDTLDRNGNDVTVSVKYPLRNIVPVSINMQMPTLYAGGGQYIAGYFDMSYTHAQETTNRDAVDLKGSSRQITDAAWANFTKLDSDLQSEGGIGAILVDYSSIGQITESRASDLEAAGIPMLSYKSADSTVESSTILTLSYLFGEDTEKIGSKYADIMDGVLNSFESKLGSMSKDDLKTYICFVMYIYICGSDSTYNSTPTTAYGRPYGEVNDDFASKYQSGSTRMDSVEALSNYTDVGCLINNRSIDWQVATSNASVADNVEFMVVSTWEHQNKSGPSPEFFKGFEDRLVYVNNILPGVAKLAYVAAALYGDQFTYEWADGILQECIDIGLAPLQGYTIEQMMPYFDYETYLAYKN